MNWPALFWGAYALGGVAFFVVAMPWAIEQRIEDTVFDFAMTTLICALVSTMWLFILVGGALFLGCAEVGRRFASKDKVSR